MFEDVGFRIFLWLFIDPDDKEPCDFTHIANLTVCRNKFLNDK